MTLFISILIYLLSTVLCWMYTHFAHSKNGVWYGNDTTVIDIILTLTPVINSILAIYAYLSDWPVKRSSKINYNRFFLIKK